MTDNELVRECLEGRTDSFRELMDRYRSHAMAVAVNILANREDAEDACQEAFLKVYRNLNTFDAGRSYKNWFYALLSNHCLDMVRKKTRFKGFLGRFRHEVSGRIRRRVEGPATARRVWTSGTSSRSLRRRGRPCTSGPRKDLRPRRSPPSWDAGPTPPRSICTELEPSSGRF